MHIRSQMSITNKIPNSSLYAGYKYYFVDFEPLNNIKDIIDIINILYTKMKVQKTQHYSFPNVEIANCQEYGSIRITKL